MQPNQILTADLLDILFDGKNKDYGAYQLRKSYKNRMSLSLMVTLLLVVIPVIIYILPAKRETELNNPWIHDPIQVTPDIIIENRIEPPTSSSKQTKQIKTIASTAITIVPDKDATEADKPPLQADLDNVKIGLINQDGDPDKDLVMPDASKAGTGNGTTGISTTVQGSGEGFDNFRPIEIESEYPGGQKAWSRFLNRTLGNNYPPEAFEKGIQGTVVIQFIVDIDGTVSNIEVLSGPEELRDAAISTIKKSGKWRPAIQNGRNVKTYKKQPITFILQGEQ